MRIEIQKRRPKDIKPDEKNKSVEKAIMKHTNKMRIQQLWKMKQKNLNKRQTEKKKRKKNT